MGGRGKQQSKVKVDGGGWYARIIVTVRHRLRYFLTRKFGFGVVLIDLVNFEPR